MGKAEFPITLPDCLEVARVIIKEIGIGPVSRSRATAEQVEAIMAVDLLTGNQAAARFVGWQRLAGEPSDRGQQVDRHQRLMTDCPGRNLSGEPGEAGHPHASFEGRPFPLPQWPRRAGVVAVGQPRAVVTGEDHQGVVKLAGLLQGF